MILIRGMKNKEKALRDRLFAKLYLMIASFGLGKPTAIQNAPKSPIKKIDHKNG
jgi:hypothetical protein